MLPPCILELGLEPRQSDVGHTHRQAASEPKGYASAQTPVGILPSIQLKGKSRVHMCVSTRRLVEVGERMETQCVVAGAHLMLHNTRELSVLPRKFPW